MRGRGLCPQRPRVRCGSQAAMPTTAADVCSWRHTGRKPVESRHHLKSVNRGSVVRRLHPTQPAAVLAEFRRAAQARAPAVARRVAPTGPPAAHQCAADSQGGTKPFEEGQ